MKSTTLPELTNEQRRAASERGVKARQARAEMCGKVKRGEVTLVDVLNSEDPVIGKMRTYDLLRAIPGFGVTKAQKMMDEFGIARSRRIQGLGHRQRDALLAWYTYNELWEKLDKKDITAKEILESDDRIIGQMQVADLIAAAHGFGEIRAGKVMRGLGIWSEARICELKPEKRDKLIDVLDNGKPYL